MAGLLPQMLMRRTELSVTTKLSAKHETPPFANVLLADVFLSVVVKMFVSFLCQVMFDLYVWQARVI